MLSSLELFELSWLLFQLVMIGMAGFYVKDIIVAHYKRNRHE